MIEKLVEIQPVKLVIVDKFANETLIEKRLNKLDPTIQLILIPKVQQNLAVAAASILARDAYLRWHKEAKGEYGTTIPKGRTHRLYRWGRLMSNRTENRHFRTWRNCTSRLQKMF
ncbi:hypothetical protein [Tumebacillus lipolyticus]|uniref:RNase H type-2 domain-containing protein n=1 Tax=Tumebacillus lipolyticus TaxID=1280370 RepID=A0ABW4ZU98_9BACL